MALAADERTRTLQELHEALHGMQGALRRLRGRETHRRGGLSFAQWQLLGALARDGELTAGALAAAAELAPPTVTHMLDDLVAAGIVERRRSESDRRVVHNRLTAKGRRLWREKEARVLASWTEALADVPDEELAHGTRILQRLRDFYDAL